MSSMIQILEDTADRILGDLATPECAHAAEQGHWPEALWNALDESGIVSAAWPESIGGSGLDLGSASTLMRRMGYYAAPVPLVEHWIAGQLLAAAGGPVEGSLSGMALLGAPTETVVRVPWGRRLNSVVVLRRDGEATVRLCSRPETVTPGLSLAGEPLDTWDLRPSHGHLEFAMGDASPAWKARAALLRSAQMAGAMRRCLELSLTYAAERKQFGRSLSAFQAIQQELAKLAGEVSAVEMAVESAAHAASHGPALLEIAVAKSRAGMAVEPVTRISHQVHGAMGFTQEHRLHLYTRRLWSWRDDYGSEEAWNGLLGRKAIGLGDQGLWPFLTSLGTV